jgi:dTDP-4-amino-4,6-dideoxygalactose transaminase
LDELQAAILLERLKWLEPFTQRRREIAGRYFNEISNASVGLLSKPIAPSAHVYHLFVVKSSKRNELMNHLKERGVQTHIHYPVPVHHQDSVPGIKTDPKGLSFIEAFSESCLSLPIHPQLSDEEVTRIIESVNSFK